MLPLTVQRAILHFNESCLTSKCLWHSGEEATGHFDQLVARGGPMALSRFDPVPIGLNPLPERGERLFKRAAEIGELVEVCSVHPTGIELPPDKTVALRAPQRIGEHLVRDAIQAFVKVLVATTSSRQLGQHVKSPAPAHQRYEPARSLPVLSHGAVRSTRHGSAGTLERWTPSGPASCDREHPSFADQETAARAMAAARTGPADRPAPGNLEGDPAFGASPGQRRPQISEATRFWHRPGLLGIWPQFVGREARPDPHRHLRPRPLRGSQRRLGSHARGVASIRRCRHVFAVCETLRSPRSACWPGMRMLLP